jgi:hypothetical protein
MKIAIIEEMRGRPAPVPGRARRSRSLLAFREYYSQGVAKKRMNIVKLEIVMPQWQILSV